MRKTSLKSSIITLTAWLLLQAAVGQSQPDMASLMPVGVVAEASGTGAYPAVAESFASMRHNTVYHPASMPAEGFPLILWGNGACRDDGLSYSEFLREVSSHGFIIVSAGYAKAPRSAQAAANNDAPAQDNAPVQRATDPTTPQQLIDAISWAEDQNNNSSSPLYQHVDLDKIAVMGHSCGGLQTLAISADPRIDTSILFNSGAINDGPDAGRSGITVLKSDLMQIHKPVAYINGGPTDIAYLNGLDDYERINHVPIFFGENQIGHGGTFRVDPNGGDYGLIATAWMSWQLKGDQHAAQMFQGEACGLCEMSGWKVMKKQID